jgi:hypothetical protein
MRKILLSLSLLLLGYFSYGQKDFGVKSGINIVTTKNIMTFPEKWDWMVCRKICFNTITEKVFFGD